MSKLKSWLREDLKRFPQLVMFFSVFGLVWLIADEVAGRGDFTTAVGTILVMLIALSLIYGRGLE